ncbi:MAG TPA: lipocalin-like domain-containing protein [Thermoanaerobaculia bacterium]|nr:lipocalin-like domain-containing protein [Thermoanaerobaculia bacterium]
MQRRLLPAVLAFSLLHSAAASDFRLAGPGYHFEFPRDHGSHDEYRTEWWYYTGHVRTESGRRYGFEVTFFRVGVVAADGPPATPWDVRHIALAHFAITDVNGKKFRYYEKLNRSSPFTAQAAAGRLNVFNESWRVTTMADGAWRLVAAEGGDAIDLVLRSAKPPALHGENGLSVKAPGVGYASHYYSMTRLAVSGTIAVPGRPAERCTGLAWMDHEFGSAVLRENQQGWDWFSVQLDNDTELMLYQIRRRDGSPDVTSSGSLITDRGEVIHITADQMRVEPVSRWRSPESGATYPMGWRLAVPGLKLSLVLKPVMEAQELITRRSTQITYWEGAVDVTGSFGNVSVSGAGYVEMTGYDKRFAQP